jgi:hypothetical protein
VFFSAVSKADLFPIQTGTDKSSDISGEITVTVKTESESRYVRIRADGPGHFVYFLLDRKNSRVYYAEYGDFSVKTGKAQEMSTRLTTEGDFATLEILGGGLFQPRQWKINLTINNLTGHLTAMKANYKIARWGLPNGIHSGPIKYTGADFNCINFLKE